MLKKGPLYVALCYMMWGLLPFFWRQLNGVDSLAVLGYRITFSLVFSVVILLIGGNWQTAMKTLQDKGQRRWLLASSAAIFVNWYGYIWAVNSGHVLDASLAYYMYPILSILVGAVFFRERVGLLQWVAVGLMTTGIVITAVSHGKIPWLALVVGGTFVAYGVLKRNVTCGPAVSLFAESLFTLPVALACIFWCEWRGIGAAAVLSGWQFVLVPLAGVVTAVPLLLFARGIRDTSNVLAGVLMIINPTTQFLIGVFAFGEEFTASYAILFAFIWGGVALFLVGNIFNSRRLKAR